jgi:anaerobic selenocysteine-containing dehydrogenase
MTQKTIEHTVCRICHAQCALIVEMTDGQPGRIYGDKDNPAYHGYSCIKGRELAAYNTLPSRLLQSRKRRPDGAHEPISSARAIDEIADALRRIIDRHGPRAVAFYIGTHGFNSMPTQAFAPAFLDAIGSPMMFTSVTIDQPGKGVANALHGLWFAGTPTIDQWDVLMLVGTNPLVSMNGGLGLNPAYQLRVAKQRGMKLIVIDPRVTDCARQADIHLQVRPGEDPAVLAGIARVLITEGLCDDAFIAAETTGFEALSRAVAPFTPAFVAARAGITAEALIAAAHLYAAGRSGAVSAGTGSNMAGRGNLTEYFVKALTTLRGYWLRPGDRIANSGVLINRLPAIAGTPGPTPAFGFGEKMRVRGLASTPSGLPTAALADEILTPGEGQVKALFVFGGNPMAAWPDQLKTYDAMRALDLLVTFDPHMSATAELSHYVIAPKLPLETEGTTMLSEMISGFGPGWGYQIPYAQYSPALIEPPEGADLVEEWEALYGVARKLGVGLRIRDLSILDPAAGKEAGTELDMDVRPTAGDVWAMLTKNAPVPLAVVKETARTGRVFNRPPMIVEEKPEDWTGRLDIGSAPMMAELDEIAAEPGPEDSPGLPYRLISRRLHDVLNSCWHEDPAMKRRAPYNPAFVNPEDMAREGLSAGDIVTIESGRGAIRAVVQPEAGVRPGCISMTHAWGGNPGRDEDPFLLGSNTGRLTAIDQDYDRYTGIPRMSNIPVAIRRDRPAAA